MDCYSLQFTNSELFLINTSRADCQMACSSTAPSVFRQCGLYIAKIFNVYGETRDNKLFDHIKVIRVLKTSGQLFLFMPWLW